jgi:hypothetical protein
MNFYLIRGVGSKIKIDNTSNTTFKHISFKSWPGPLWEKEAAMGQMVKDAIP